MGLRQPLKCIFQAFIAVVKGEIRGGDIHRRKEARTAGVAEVEIEEELARDFACSQRLLILAQ